MVKALAFNCSPKKERSNTSLILDPFLEGMRDAGAEVELLYTMRLKINPCMGEFDCWRKDIGKCFQDDDMNSLYPKLADADIWVFATPVYVDGVSGPMKDLFDRLLPLIEGKILLRDGHCRHPRRKGTKGGKVVLVSNCGFYEMDNFDPLLVHVKAACKNFDREFAGALLRPYGSALSYLLKEGKGGDVIDAAKRAGRELVKNGRMDPETLGVVSRHFSALEEYLKWVNG